MPPYCTFLLHLTAPNCTILHLTAPHCTRHCFLFHQPCILFHWPSFYFAHGGVALIPLTYCTSLHLTAPHCTILRGTILHFHGFLLEVVTPSSGEPLWAPDQHPMCLCGCSTPHSHQAKPLATSPHAQFHSHSPPYCTILHFCNCTSLHFTAVALYCTSLHHTALHCTSLHPTLRLHSCSPALHSVSLALLLFCTWRVLFNTTHLLHLTAPHCTMLHHTAPHCTFKAFCWRW